MTNQAKAEAVHSTFRIERHYAVPASRLFFAFADTASKRQWLVEGEGFEVFEHDADFRVGGREFSRFRYGQGPEITNEVTYQDIVPDQRIIFCYRMALAGAPMSASLTTVEFVPADGGTLLVHTEHGAYLDGSDDGTGREEGTRGLLETLAAHLGVA